MKHPHSPYSYLLFVVVSWAISLSAQAIEWNGKITQQDRFYVDTGAYQSQQFYPSATFSLSFEHVFTDELDVAGKVYGIYDHQDYERSGYDIREFMVRYYQQQTEYGVGIGQVTWGVNEIFKTLDVVNQKDRRDLPYASKLGQPILSLSSLLDLPMLDNVTFEGFLLYDHREAWFPGEDGRLRFPLLVDDKSLYDRDGNGRFDIASRLKFRWSGIEIGASYLYGMSRQPYFVFNGDFHSPRLIPVYEKLHRSGLSLLKAFESIIVKAELAYETGGVEQFESVAGGIEYAYGTVLNSDTELTLYLEAIWDSRDNNPSQLLDHDVGIAARFAFNDAQDSQLVLGAMIDYKYKEAISYGFFRQSVGESWSISLIGQYFHAHEPRLDTATFQDEANELVQQLDAGNFPIDEATINELVDLFSDVSMNKRQFDIVVAELQRLQTDANYVSDLPLDTIPQTLFDLLRVSDDSQKMNLIERDAFLQLDVSYHF